jgi:hypothetical protein
LASLEVGKVIYTSLEAATELETFLEEVGELETSLEVAEELELVGMQQCLQRHHHCLEHYVDPKKQ